LQNELILKQPLHFSYLPAYCNFVSTKHLNDFVISQITLSKAMQLPLSTFFTQLKEEALFELALTATLPLLQHLAHNKADGYVNNLVEESRTYYVTFLGVYEFSAPDISQMLYIQKKGLTDLLPKYTSSVTLLISIIGELDILFATIEDTIKKKVLLANTDTKGHPDNFLQNINDTSPGIIYLQCGTTYNNICKQ